LKYKFELLRRFLGSEDLKPLRFDKASTDGSGRLLVLSGEIVFAHYFSYTSESFERLSFRMEGFTWLANKFPASVGSIHNMTFGFLGDRRKFQELPTTMLQNVTDQIIFMEPLHNHNDATYLFVI
jgi:hypothetical protein